MFLPLSASASGSQIKLRCEFCGRMVVHTRFRRSKRFCSVACAKRYNVGCTRRMGLFQSRHRAKLTSVTNPFARKKRIGLATVSNVKKTWKRGQGGRVTTGPIQRTSEVYSYLACPPTICQSSPKHVFQFFGNLVFRCSPF